MDTIEFLQGDKWLKHPLHPGLVALPIGIWTFGAAMDGIASVTKNDCIQEAADAAVIGGLVGAGVSAMTGITEFLRVPSGEATEDAAIHGTLNAAAIRLFAVNGLIRTARRNRGRPGGLLPKLLSLAGVTLIGYTGWLGGNLVFNHGTAVQAGKGQEQREAEQPEIRQREEARASM